MTVTLPNEIIREILILKDQHEQHNKFTDVLQNIPLKSSFLKIKKIKDLYINDENRTTFHDRILNYYNYDFDELLNQIEYLDRCKCCKKHQQKRATRESAQNGIIYENYETTGYLLYSDICYCPCKTMAIHYSRAYNSVIHNQHLEVEI